MSESNEACTAADRMATGAAGVILRATVQPVCVLAYAWSQIWCCWDARSVLGWVAALLWVLLLNVWMEGWTVAPVCSPWLLWTGRGAGLVALLSVLRLSALHRGGDPVGPVVCGAALALSLVALVRARRHRWGAPLSAPLLVPFAEGVWWVAQGGGRGINHHVGHARQRGAIDLIATCSTGSRRSYGPAARRRLESYTAYGAQLLAPCAGTVLRTVDGMPDEPVGNPSPDINPCGNHVVIDTGHELVVLAHLRPGSVRVATGDRVAAGQPIGQVGNSGNSTEPHLHLHAERDGLGLDLAFVGVGGGLYRGRRVRVRPGTADTETPPPEPRLRGRRRRADRPGTAVPVSGRDRSPRGA